MVVVMAAAAQRASGLEDETDGGGSNLGMEKKTDLQQHLQAMFALLPQDHVLKEVVRLESANRNRLRYLAVVAYSPRGPEGEEETCVLGFDCAGDRPHATLGLVLCLYADSGLTLDGDGGFCVTSGGAQHVFKPVSVHVLWAVLQSLHKACARAQKYNHYPGGGTHKWVESYRITSDRSCLNEWNYLPDLESRRRPSSPPNDKADRERAIRMALKEVMMSLDLDVATSKEIRKRVEDELGMDLSEYKSFLDQEMLVILGQMDGASRIFDELYLGSEWNASNMEELERNGIGHILNVTREIDNFFPDQFDYLNVRVYDDEATELLKHWDRTYKYIRQAVESGSKVLVHCKMGVSRSASVVVAYAMKARHWDLPQALRHVKERRACVKPNASFMHQLEIYAGILDASRQRHNSLWRSKSETNLVSKPAHLPAKRTSGTPATAEPPASSQKPHAEQPRKVADSPSREKKKAESCSTPPTTPLITLEVLDDSGSGRPKSWSPDDSLADALFPSSSEPDASEEGHHQESDANRAVSVSLRVPCSNGRTYSVSQNRAVQLESSPPPPPPPPPHRPCFSMDDMLGVDSSPTGAPLVLVECVNTAFMGESPPNGLLSSLPRVGSVKDRIFELEAAATQTSSRSGLVLNLHPTDASSDYHQFYSGLPTVHSSPIIAYSSSAPSDGRSNRHHAGGASRKRREGKSSADVFSARVDRVFDREERRQSDGSIQRESPHRQHSWGAGENRLRPEESNGLIVTSDSAETSSPPLPTSHQAANWMSSYASDPSLSTSEPPLGLVRMQREALLEKTHQQQRRSLPEEKPLPQPGGKSTTAPPLNRSISDSTSGSVMRLRRELEAKAAFPLTGSFAPPPLVVAALAAALHSTPSSPLSSPTRTSPTTRRPRRPVDPAEPGRLRKRSLSLDKVSLPAADWSQAAQDAADQVDLNVKLLVDMFETPSTGQNHPHQPGRERPRGWSESSLPGSSIRHPRPSSSSSSSGHTAQRRSLMAKPPVPEPPDLSGPSRKVPYGKMQHPLDRLPSTARQKVAQQPVFGTM